MKCGELCEHRVSEVEWVDSVFLGMSNERKSLCWISLLFDLGWEVQSVPMSSLRPLTPSDADLQPITSGELLGENTKARERIVVYVSPHDGTVMDLCKPADEWTPWERQHAVRYVREDLVPLLVDPAMGTGGHLVGAVELSPAELLHLEQAANAKPVTDEQREVQRAHDVDSQ